MDTKFGILSISKIAALYLNIMIIFQTFILFIFCVLREF